MSAIVVFLLFVVQFAQAASGVGGAPQNPTYNPKAFNGFAAAGITLLALFVLLSVITRNAVDKQKIRDAAKDTARADFANPH